MKIALYEMSGSSMVWEASEWREEDPDTIRTTEVVDVEFVDLPDEVVVPKKVKAIDDKIEAARAKFGQAIQLLEDEKSKLLAITHEPS